MLIVWEIRKLFGETAARAGLGVVAAVLAVALVAYSTVPGQVENVTSIRERVAAGLPETPAAALGGFGFARSAVVPVAGVLVPVILCMVLAGVVAGEDERGTLAETLSRPAARWKIALAKLGAGVVYLFALMAVAAVVSIAVSSLALGPGKLFVGRTVETVSDSTGVLEAQKFVSTFLTGGAALWRLCAAWAASGVALAPVVALALLASCAARRALTAATISVGVYLGLYSAAQPWFFALGAVRRYLIVGRFEVWRAILGPEVNWNELLASGAVIAVVFALLAAGAVMLLRGREVPPRG